jgi:hypothetical protein
MRLLGGDERQKAMHYANGREAKNGDRVLRMAPANNYGKPIIGILHDAVAGNDNCNGNLAAPIADQPGCNLAECLHMDDVRAIVGEIKNVPDTSKA